MVGNNKWGKMKGVRRVQGGCLGEGSGDEVPLVHSFIYKRTSRLPISIGSHKKSGKLKLLILRREKFMEDLKAF